MSYALNLSVAFIVLDCATCGMPFAIQEAVKERRKVDGKDFYCPAGHVNVYRETEVQRLKRELEQKEVEKQRIQKEKEWAEQSRERAREEARRQERRARSYRGVVTRTKKRVGNGVCPCCNRTFQNMMRHMKTKHPKYHETRAAAK